MATKSLQQLKDRLLFETKQSNSMRLKRNDARTKKAKQAWQTLIDLADESKNELRAKIKEMEKGLKSPAFKGFKKKPKKSKACSKVLQLMDRDYPYGNALKMVLDADKRLNKKKLEAELDFYV